MFAMSDRTAPLESIAVCAAADALRGLVAVARALVESGRAVELDGLEAEAERVCAAAACLPRAAGFAVIPTLESAVREIDALREALAGAH